MKVLFRLVFASILAMCAHISIVQANSLTIATTWGPNAEVPDPRAGYNGWMSNQSGVTETLMGIDYELNLSPRLAQGIEQSSPTTWRATLKNGLTFHDGSPVTSQAVVDAIAAISIENSDSHNPRIVDLLDLAEMSIDGDQVVVFETNSPNAAFPWTLSEPGIAILGTPSDEFPINATGPYIFREAIPEQLYRAEANADYRLGKPGFEEVNIVIAGDPAAAALAFEAGEVDMVINYPEADFERIKSTGAAGFSAPTARLYFFTVNAASGPMANPLIRRAISKAIDRNGIVDAALSGVGGVPAGTIYPDGKGWAADISATYDPAAAEALLAEAGALKLQAWVTTPQGDPGAVLEALLKTDGGSNSGGYTNTELDALLDKGRETFDHDARKEIYHTVQQIVADDAAMIPVFHVSQVNVAREGLTGYAVHPTETYWITHETTLSE